MKRFSVVFLCFLLTACLSANLRQYGNIDNSQKSITVPAGSGLAAELKDVLKRNGWSLVVDAGPNVVEGKNGQTVNLKSYSTFKSRYRLLLNYNQYDVCLGRFDPVYRYDMSMIDNKTGEEIMVMGGSACEYQIKEKFEAFLTSAHK